MDAVTYVYNDLDIVNNDVSISEVKESLNRFCEESIKLGRKCIEWNSEEIYWMHKRLHTKYNPGQTCSNYLGYCDAPHCTFCG
uniref:Radical SAM protein n=1 Tax=Panagrellus redivivus TaxID=6233 RepID=A0A7E4UPK3_PANRE